MIKRLIAAGALAAMAISPAFAQDDPQDDSATATAEVAATAAPRPASAYAKVDFNPEDDRDNILLLDLSNGQRVAIRLMPDWAPQHVERIKTLARQGFYDGVIFHRVIDGFMAQTGDPTGTGQGGSQLPDLQQEFNPMPHVRGTVSMARAAGEDSANSQFFIVFYPKLALDRNYTNFGRVIAGMDAVDAIHRGEPPQDPTYIVQASIASDDKPMPVASTVLPKGVQSQGAITADLPSAPGQQ
ncbi:peptidylprolyl isomerase [Erythrobacter sp. LQ02-29]|uniref:peptidylprolyl isomerase n=1 Tax=Erythrobacter sp. LQ02-29 TaxID=2920384 RepID=UPI001F4E680F|nr:peptidylprolyl isomerase [Erythrobacter sp. LQ02-29]MCP9223101.1 peptidylprolyl isomerase [Erythrobacter sp. LQ02-29]